MSSEAYEPLISISIPGCRIGLYFVPSYRRVIVQGKPLARATNCTEMRPLCNLSLFKKNNDPFTIFYDPCNSVTRTL